MRSIFDAYKAYVKAYIMSMNEANIRKRIRCMKAHTKVRVYTRVYRRTYVNIDVTCRTVPSVGAVTHTVNAQPVGAAVGPCWACALVAPGGRSKLMYG